MLHKNPKIIAPKTFELIQELQKMPFLQNFYLVGGTALALQLGHRNSIDIDLFTQNEFLAEELAEILTPNFNFSATLFRKNTVLANINFIKTDFIRHNYPLIGEPIEKEGIRMLSKEDIAAMKVHAITQSGKRLKDFIDIYFLLEVFSLNEIVKFYVQKYTYSNQMIAIKAINYFDDIDENIDPPNLLKPLTVSNIKKRINEATLHPTKLFT